MISASDAQRCLAQVTLLLSLLTTLHSQIKKDIHRTCLHSSFSFECLNQQQQQQKKQLRAQILSYNPLNNSTFSGPTLFFNAHFSLVTHCVLHSHIIQIQHFKNAIFQEQKITFGVSHSCNLLESCDVTSGIWFTQ